MSQIAPPLCRNALGLKRALDAQFGQRLRFPKKTSHPTPLLQKKKVPQNTCKKWRRATFQKRKRVFRGQKSPPRHANHLSWPKRLLEAPLGGGKIGLLSDPPLGALFGGPILELQCE